MIHDPEATAGLLERALREVPEAGPLARLCAALAPAEAAGEDVAVPVDLLVAGAPDLPEPLSAALADETHRDALLARLREHGIAAGDDTVRFPRAALDAAGSPDEDRKRWAGLAATVVLRAFPPEPEEPAAAEACERLFPFARAVAERCAAEEVVPERAAELFARAGRWRLARSAATEAEPLLRAALSRRERAHGAGDARIATDLAYLNGALLPQGRDAEAAENGRRALEVLEGAYGPGHRLTVLHTNNLGALLRRAGDLEGAEAAFALALERAEAAFGGAAPFVATVNSNFADMLVLRGDLPTARAHLERALAIDEAAYGPRHSSVARDLHKLARVLARLGEGAAAAALFRRALEHAEATRGADDAHTRALRAEVEAVERASNTNRDRMEG